MMDPFSLNWRCPDTLISVSMLTTSLLHCLLQVSLGDLLTLLLIFLLSILFVAGLGPNGTRPTMLL